MPGRSVATSRLRQVLRTVELVADAAPRGKELRAKPEIAIRGVGLVGAPVQTDAVTLDGLKGESVGHVRLLGHPVIPSGRAPDVRSSPRRPPDGRLSHSAAYSATALT